ncbi:DUF4158 domain-containing protein [Streptomyces sp. NPDC006706]|uniref:DUF4158 domain-containing protein n=1 Tax=Streptomyces sp. NPDC006706 TaxID=3364761 RepID=UPI0036A18387
MDHFTLSGDEAGWLRNKTGATRLGFAVQLKFLTWRGRLPKMRLELPPDAVEHVAKQVGVGAAELGFYDFTSRAAKRHRSERVLHPRARHPARRIRPEARRRLHPAARAGPDRRRPRPGRLNQQVLNLAKCLQRRRTLTTRSLPRIGASSHPSGVTR